ncbi:MAG TPA: BTAD domain-containing putative transcriptional regulator [Thermomicrobiales bacterium]|nr:BTAD domain-containing putative transcriptional regulator [Thermomicrobiales bacterium]
MEWPAVEERLAEARAAVADLLERGECCLAAGQARRAATLLDQGWALAKRHSAELADAAAWNAGWLLARAGAFADAAVWFARVASPPAGAPRLGPASRRAAGEQRPGRARDDPRPAPPLPPLVVTSLGRFQVARAGAVLPACTARKALAIFRYLLTRAHRAAHKDELIELLWPDAPAREAGHSLHVAVSALRRYLDPPDPAHGSYLQFEVGHYQLHPRAPIEDDRARFLQLSEEGDHWWRRGDADRARQAYADALAGYGGDYHVDDADPAWALGERERLLACYLTALDRLGHIAMAQGQHETAIECYRRLLERDGYREDAHGQLMRCYWRLGRRGEALRQYERCAATLAADLGLEPLPELRELHRVIAGAAPPAAREKARAPR